MAVGPDELVEPVKKTTKHVVAFVDLLGFSDQTRKWAQRGREDELLQIFSSVFDKVAGFATSGDHREFDAQWFTRFFTDNIVMAFPLLGNGRDHANAAGLACRTCGIVEAQFAIHGMFARGGIAVGQLYSDANLIFGTGLLDAYELERSAAVDPRIVVDEPVVELFRSHPNREEFDRVLRRDVDGRSVINYLDSTRFADGAERGGDFDLATLRDHKSRLVEALDEERHVGRVLRKIQWLAA